ncbi:MAG: rhodanese-like domain-containing protein [Alkalispirochaetaceae bacterium]
MKREMSYQEFCRAIEDAEIIDIRTPEEYDSGHIPGAKNINIYDDTFLEEIGALDRRGTYALYCRSGGRTAKALMMMEGMGFESVGHLEGGILDWEGELE